MGQDTEPETEVLKRTRDTREYAPRLRRALASTGGVHDGTKRETVELASGTDGVGPHIVEGKPVTDGERPRAAVPNAAQEARGPPAPCAPGSEADLALAEAFGSAPPFTPWRRSSESGSEMDAA